MVKFEVTADCDSSDDELDGVVDQCPLQVDWLRICEGLEVGITSLPGCISAIERRSLRGDLDSLCKMGIQDVFVFCTATELRRFKVGKLLWEYDRAGMVVHNWPLEADAEPDLDNCVEIVSELLECIRAGRRTLIHCLGGLGRSCLVASVLLLTEHEALAPTAAIDALRQLRGPGAVQTVRQYNFITGYRQRLQRATSAAVSPADDTK